MARKHDNKSGVPDAAAKQFAEGYKVLGRHPIFAPLLYHADVIRAEKNLCPDDGLAVVTQYGAVHVHPTRKLSVDEWIYVIAHGVLHLGFEHVKQCARQREWNTACDCFVARFLADLKLGRPPRNVEVHLDFQEKSEQALYERFCAEGIPAHLQQMGVGCPHANDMLFIKEPVNWHWSHRHDLDWQQCLGQGLAAAVVSALKVAGGVINELGADGYGVSPAQRARDWFISSYPLLGALAATFRIIEDQVICHRLEISVAAIDMETKEIFINPAAGLDEYESRFVMGHELLHAGLRHDTRRRGRDPYLWNVACDYVINGWLVEMGLGELPKIGTLYDPELKGMSAEVLYDLMVTDLRRYRKLATLRGCGLSDMLERGQPDWWAVGDGMGLDDFYRRALGQGLVYHDEQGRGYLPAGLIEEIRALSQPPIPWDVELAQWFDDHFAPLEKRRTFARPSRRQSSTPDIPRPSGVPALGAEDGRTFGVVLDTSGSMDRTLLAKALGAIASYSIARDVPAVRVIFCDAVAYDQGYMPPEAIAEEVKVKGRGGTILQPGIDLLEGAEDFPEDGPLLIITDGFCDRLHIRHEHAFLLPQGRRLPFVPKGKVFSIW